MFARQLTRIGKHTVEARDQLAAQQQLERVSDIELVEGRKGACGAARKTLRAAPEKRSVKLLPPEKVGEPMLRRFEREVQLTSQLTHPNTIAIFDYGHTPNGIFYYPMEYLDGIDLDRLVWADGPQAPASTYCARCAAPWRRPTTWA